MNDKITLLFLCTGNSCRSQMAEGLCRHYRGESINTFSAGIEQQGVNPLAVQVMQEIGIDIGMHTSKKVEELSSIRFDYVVTVCGHVNEACPYFPAQTECIHQGFDDPPQLASNAKTDDEALIYYRRVRDEIKTYVLSLPNSLLSDNR